MYTASYAVASSDAAFFLLYFLRGRATRITSIRKFAIPLHDEFAILALALENQKLKINFLFSIILKRETAGSLFRYTRVAVHCVLAYATARQERQQAATIIRDQEHRVNLGFRFKTSFDFRPAPPPCSRGLPTTAAHTVPTHLHCSIHLDGIPSHRGPTRYTRSAANSKGKDESAGPQRLFHGVRIKVQPQQKR